MSSPAEAPPTILDFFFFGGEDGGGPAGFAIIFAAWLVGYLGWSYTFVFIATASVYCYKFRVSRRAKRREIWSIQQCLQEPQVAQKILGTDLPMWLKFPSVEKCVWLDRVITSMWPEIAKATEQSIIDSLNPTLEYYRPKFLTKLCMGVTKMGSVPLQVTGIQSFRETDQETIIDMYVTWRGNPDIRMIAAVGMVAVEVKIHDFQLNGLLRMVLGPHVPVWPCFSALSLSFVGKPNVDFSLKAAKIPFDAIPGLSAWLDGFLRNTLTWLMVYPKRLVCPMLDPSQYGSQESSAEPVGTVHVTIHGCEDLHDKGFFTKLQSFATVAVLSGGDEKKEKKTQTVKGKNPKFNAKFSFVVYNVPNERLVISMIDDGNVVSKAAKTATEKLKVGFDNLIGRVEVFVASLIDTEHDSTMRLVDPKHSTESVGRIHFTTQFTPFQKVGQTDEGSFAAEPAPDGTSSSRSLPTEGGETGGLRNRQATMRHPPDATPTGKSGLLLITLDRAEDLVKADMFGQSDPYVIFTIGTNSAKSAVIYKTLNPVWGEEKFELEVPSVSHDILEVRVYDKDIMKDEVIGRTSIAVQEIWQANGRLRQSWSLEPKGKITLELKLLTNAN